METLRKQCGREGVPAYMIEKGQSVPNPDSDFSNLFVDHVFSIYFQEDGEAEVGGHAEFSQIVPRKKMVEKIEKDRRKLGMICFFFHLCFFSWFATMSAKDASKAAASAEEIRNFSTISAKDATKSAKDATGKEAQSQVL